MIKATIICGLQYGDEGKGKIISQLTSSGNFNWVARWAGGGNAGHTVYFNNKKVVTHQVPTGIVHGIPAIIGPGCVINPRTLIQELKELSLVNPNVYDLLHIHPNAHVVMPQHLDLDAEGIIRLGTTGQGIGPCYADRAARKGSQAHQNNILKDFIKPYVLEGQILCEGAQAVWLDLDHGAYPYVTSGPTLPYSACSIGFTPWDITEIIGVAKVYETRVGQDPNFEDDPTYGSIIREAGKEYGATTGRPRRCRPLNVQRLIEAINLTGATSIVINKLDILLSIKLWKTFDSKFDNENDFKHHIIDALSNSCERLINIEFQSTP